MVYAVICALMAAVIALALKVHVMKKSAREIGAELKEKIHSDTNTQIRITSRDKDMRRLSEDINTQLRELRQEQLHYHQGNAELKTAITNISHDIRTPLTAICGYLDMLEKTDDSDKKNRYIVQRQHIQQGSRVY